MILVLLVIGDEKQNEMLSFVVLSAIAVCFLPSLSYQESSREIIFSGSSEMFP